MASTVPPFYRQRYVINIKQCLPVTSFNCKLLYTAVMCYNFSRMVMVW